MHTKYMESILCWLTTFGHGACLGAFDIPRNTPLETSGSSSPRRCITNSLLVSSGALCPSPLLSAESLVWACAGLVCCLSPWVRCTLALWCLEVVVSSGSPTTSGSHSISISSSGETLEPWGCFFKSSVCFCSGIPSGSQAVCSCDVSGDSVWLWTFCQTLYVFDNRNGRQECWSGIGKDPPRGLSNSVPACAAVLEPSTWGSDCSKEGDLLPFSLLCL